MKRMHRMIADKKFLLPNILRAVILLCLMLVCLSAWSQNESLTVIGNKKGAPQQMKLAELRSIMMGERQRWKDGNKIKIALMKTNTPVGTYTCKKVYDMSEDELKKFWLALVFQGKADAPVFFNSPDELKTFVSENEGAIGIVNIPVDNSAIQVVQIDGKKEF